MLPKVSVVMSVYNGSRYLREAVDSILNQTFTDFEFIIIDDCSTEPQVGEILRQYEKQDQRIKLLQNETNLGLTKSLNKGLAKAQGEYIARMDADDISYPNRLASQVEFMDLYDSVALISTYAQYIDSSGKHLRVHQLPEDPKTLKWNLIFRNPLRHSTVMWRNNLVASQVGNYNPKYTYTQDYDLWSRINQKLKIATLPSITVAIRHHENSITLTKLEDQDKLVTVVTANEAGRYLKREVTESQARQLRLMSRHKHSLQRKQFNQLSPETFKEAIQFYLNLWKAFKFQELSNVESNLSRSNLFQEIELDLLDLLYFTKQKRWGIQAWNIISQYLLLNPVRIYQFLQFSVPKLLPYRLSFAYRWYQKIRSTMKSKTENYLGDKE